MSFSSKAKKYFIGLKSYILNVRGVALISPYENHEARKVVGNFYTKFYSDQSERLFIIGINPGRFGGGLTGIAFTDPVALRERCGIENKLGKRKELSSKFIYHVADGFGGVDMFFSKVFLTALYPFAIVKNEKNYNYYAERSLADMLKPQIVKNIKKQIGFGARKDLAILLGKKNAEYFFPINEEHKFFRKIVVLEHPRYIMQYRLKKIDYYTQKYIDTINQA